MKTAIAGVVPPESAEATIMVVWPSVGASTLGRFLGQLFLIGSPRLWVLTPGRLLMLLSIPIAVPLYLSRVLPGIGVRYRLTNRRVLIEKAVVGTVVRAVELREFDAIEVVYLPGQRWYPCGQLVFTKGQVETFRLQGVPRPEAFRQACLKAQRAFVGVQQIRERELAGV